MAHKDPNVFNRINTLNTNLENANTTEVQGNISNRLFGVLDGANNISVDSELYASINDVVNVSDLNSRIAAITFPSRITVNTTNIINTQPLRHANTHETQDSINRIINSENDLTSLETILEGSLKSRLNENIEKLRNISDEQSIVATARGTTRIENELRNQNGLKARINNIKRILSNIIVEHNRSGGPRIPHLLNLLGEFNTADKTGINIAYQTIHNVTDLNEVTILQGNYVSLSDTTNNRISTLEHEKNLRTYIDGLNTTPLHIPNGFLPFTDTGTVASEGPDQATTDRYISVFNNRITQLNNLKTEIPNIRTRYAENKEKLNRILQLQKLQDKLNATHPGEMNRRQNELQTVSDISYSNLLLGENIAGRPRPAATYQPNLPNTIITVGCAPTIVHLNFIHGAALARPGRFDYELCDNNGNPLRHNGRRYEYQNGAQTVSLGGISFVNNNITNQTMTIDNLQVTPLEGLTFPLSLDLNVRVRIHDNATGLDIDHHKPIHLEITAPTLPQNSPHPGDPSREAAYDSLTPPMNDRITAEYTDRYREELENEAIWKILREGGNEAEVNEIYNNEARRNMLINRIRRRLRVHFPFLAIGNLQTGFKADMIRENRDVPVQYLLSQTSFQNYVRQSIPGNLRNFASGLINTNASAYRDDILQEFIDFQTDISNNPKDNLDNLRALAQVPGDNNGPQNHPDSRRQRITGRNSRRNNYTKFFQGRSANIENQTLETEDGKIKYGVNVECTGVNKITATITIDGKDEPEIIEAANHDRLIRGILNRANTKDGEPLNRKLRCNIALSILKAMVMMSPQRLNREIPPTNFNDARGNPVTCDRIEANIYGGNLRIRGGNVNPANHTRQNVSIFDENQFKNLHDANLLENGIRELSTQINSIMNAAAQEYQNATDSVRENRGLLKYNTAQRLRGGPIKRLRGRIAYGKTNNNFDFETSVNDAGKNVNISFNGGKFIVTGEFDGQEYRYEAKDLGSILRKKINRKRVFDGIELAMVAAINEEYVSRLRTNNLIQTENFAVTDFDNNKTGKVYIFDEDGNLSYLEIEDRALNPLGGRNSGRIDPASIPVQRIRCNAQERKEFFQSPFLAGRLLREMRRRLAIF